MKRYPKLRGYRVQRTFPAFQVVSLAVIERAFKAKEVVNPASLLKKHVVKHSRGTMPRVKILASGEITKALTFEGCSVSKNAKALIEKAGGTMKA